MPKEDNMPEVPEDAEYREIRMRLLQEQQEKRKKEELAQKERDQQWLQEIIAKAEREDKERKEREEQQLLQKKQLQKEREKRQEEWRFQQEKEQKEREEKWAQEILSHNNEWGSATCQMVLDRKIKLGMTVEMVTLALGTPTTVDEKIITEKDKSFRWIYGIPRQGATYLWFKNGQVTKIKQ
jgi:hypothetical protein